MEGRKYIERKKYRFYRNDTITTTFIIFTLIILNVKYSLTFVTSARGAFGLRAETVAQANSRVYVAAEENSHYMKIR